MIIIFVNLFFIVVALYVYHLDNLHYRIYCVYDIISHDDFCLI